MLQTSNINEIEQMTIMKPIKKRLQCELQTIEKLYDKIIVKNTTNNEILLVLERNKNKYCFNITIDYPFKAPKLYINNMNLYQFFNLKSDRFRNTLKTLTGLECLCCNSILCQGSWSPAITFDRIVNEIEKYKTYKYWVFVKLMLDKIKDKYLNSDIDIESWLFSI